MAILCAKSVRTSTLITAFVLYIFCNDLWRLVSPKNHQIWVFLLSLSLWQIPWFNEWGHDILGLGKNDGKMNTQFNAQIHVSQTLKKQTSRLIQWSSTLEFWILIVKKSQSKFLKCHRNHTQNRAHSAIAELPFFAVVYSRCYGFLSPGAAAVCWAELEHMRKIRLLLMGKRTKWVIQRTWKIS